MKYVVFYNVNVEVEAADQAEADKVANQLRPQIGFDFSNRRGIPIAVRDETLIVNLQRVVEWSDR